ncbi:MAG: hypothetical protein ACRDV3_11610 [Acidothermaceae bacterium]
MSAADDVVTRVATGAMPDGIVAAYGSLWVANYGAGTVSRIDPVQRRVLATVSVAPGPISLADAGGAIWVAGYDTGAVTRIDPQTDRVTATAQCGGKIVAVASGGGAVWAFDQSGQRAVPLDPTTAQLGNPVDLGVSAGFVTAADGLLWVPDFQGGSAEVVAFDPSAKKVVRRVHVGTAPIEVSFAAGSGWVSNTGDATVTRFAPATGDVDATIAVSGGSLGPLFAEDDAVWVSIYSGGSIARIDPATNRVAAQLAVGAEPQTLARTSSGLWVAESADGDVALLRQP